MSKRVFNQIKEGLEELFESIVYDDESPFVMPYGPTEKDHELHDRVPPKNVITRRVDFKKPRRRVKAIGVRW